MVKIGPKPAWAGNKPSGAQDIDTALMNELYESIEKHPPGIEPKRVLVEWFLAAGWTDSARETIRELRSLVPYDNQIKSWYAEYCEEKSEDEDEAIDVAGPSTVKRSLSYLAAEKQEEEASKEPDIDFDAAKAEFETGIKGFRERAVRLRFFMLLQQKAPGTPKFNHEIETLDGLLAGKLGSTLRTIPNAKNMLNSIDTGRPESSMAIVKKLKKNPTKAFAIVMEDFEIFNKWSKAQPGAKTDEDSLKTLLLARKKLIDADISEELKIHTDTAMMHMDREMFKRKYVNSETMLGDEIVDIERKNFLVTEDGYAWDMEELVQAIKSNDGVMRNPLSKHMFTPADIKSILRHPEGGQLKALQVAQSKLKKGIRPKTIEEMQKLAKAFLDDMEDEAMKSRLALDEFLAYMATLPDEEQKAIDLLKVPAKDSHTGMAYDSTIGEAVRDAKANKLCFHKAGDFIGQAAKHLQSS